MSFEIDLERARASYYEPPDNDIIYKDCFRCNKTIYEGENYYNIYVKGKTRIYCKECITDDYDFEEELDQEGLKYYLDDKKVDELFEIETQINDGLVEEKLYIRGDDYDF